MVQQVESLSSYVTATGSNASQPFLLPTPCVLVCVTLAIRFDSATDGDTWVVQARETNDNQTTDDDAIGVLAFAFGNFRVAAAPSELSHASWVYRFPTQRYYPKGIRTIYGMCIAGTGTVAARVTVEYFRA